MKQSSVDLQLEDSTAGLWHLKGDLSMYGVSALSKVLTKRLPHAGPWRIDCQDVPMIDSAGIALLLKCMRHAKSHHITLSIVALPAAAKNLIQAQGVSELFKDCEFR